MADKRGMVRTRNFATVVYPESAPENWLELLGEQCVPAFVSPLHENDITPTGEPKKPHHHVMICFDSVKTSEQAKEVFHVIGGVGLELVKSNRAYARYLCHLDNPEKAQYNPDDVKQFGGLDYHDTIGLAIDNYRCLTEIIAFCRDNEVKSFNHLIDICIEEHFEWFRVLCDGGVYMIKEYLKSYSWDAKN